MCGRIEIKPPRKLRELFPPTEIPDAQGKGMRDPVVRHVDAGVDDLIGSCPTPMQMMPILRAYQGRSDRDVELITARWGWPARGSLHVHARSEEAAEKPTFRLGWSVRRAAILCTAWFEAGWRFSLRQNREGHLCEPFFLPGLWQQRADEPLELVMLTQATPEPFNVQTDRFPIPLTFHDAAVWVTFGRLHHARFHNQIRDLRVDLRAVDGASQQTFL